MRWVVMAVRSCHVLGKPKDTRLACPPPTRDTRAACPTRNHGRRRQPCKERFGPSWHRPASARGCLRRLSARREARRECPEGGEALRPLAVEPFEVGLAGQLRIVNAVRTAAAEDAAAALVQLEPYLAGDVTLGLLEEALQGAAEVVEPESAVDQFGKAV